MGTFTRICQETHKRMADFLSGSPSHEPLEIDCYESYTRNGDTRMSV